VEGGIFWKKCTRSRVWKKSKKLMHVEEGFFLWRMEFFKIGKHDFTFIKEMRVLNLFEVETTKASKTDKR
jgi:hypothetical protein